MTLFLYLFAGYILFIAFLYWKQRDFIYFPDPAPLPALEAFELPVSGQVIEVSTPDNLTLQGWFFPPSDFAPIIVFFHGNAGGIQNRLFKTIPFASKGYGILLAEYRGYGPNPGQPSEDGFYNDGRAYMQWLQNMGYDPAQIVLYGESLGTGVAVQMAQEQPVKALILDTPYAALSDGAKNRFPFIPFIEYLMQDRYRSVDKIKDIEAPKLFIIAEKDEVLGPQTGLALYETANAPKTLVVLEGSGHNNTHDFGLMQHVYEFLETLPLQKNN